MVADIKPLVISHRKQSACHSLKESTYLIRAQTDFGTQGEEVCFLSGKSLPRLQWLELPVDYVNRFCLKIYKKSFNCGPKTQTEL